MKFYLTLLIFLFGLTSYGQNKIQHISNGKENAIEFISEDNKVLKKIDINSHSPYAKLNYPSIKDGSLVIYKFPKANVQSFLRSFFLNKNDLNANLEPISMIARSEVIPQKKLVIVSDHLTLYGSGGILGIKSKATIYDETGILVGTLPENNDGYFTPAVTENGNFLGTKYGDVSPHAEVTALPQPGFRLYDVKTGVRVIDIPSNGFDIYPTISYGNVIRQVLRHQSGQYEYLFFQTDKRILYRRKFSSEEIDEFIRFTDTGVVLRRGAGETLLEFAKDFTASNF